MPLRSGVRHRAALFGLPNIFQNVAYLSKLSRRLSLRPSYNALAGVVAAAAALMIIAACADQPTTAPPSVHPVAPAMSTTTTTTTVNALLWTKAVAQTTVSKVIGPAGGSLSIPNGIKVTVPPGAVASNLTFSVTRLPGTIVAYDFQPHGTVFAAPLLIEQPTLGTNLFKLDPASSIQGAYFLSTSMLDQTNGTAAVSEFEPTFVSADKAWVRFTVKHFSGYLVSSGRR